MSGYILLSAFTVGLLKSKQKQIKQKKNVLINSHFIYITI